MTPSDPGDTIVALSSGGLPAAIAVIRTSGPHAFAAAHRIAGPLGTERRASLRDLRDPADGTLIDRALILHFAGPNTATGEDIVEYQCHGSRAVVHALIATLVSRPSLRLADPGEFTRRALRHGRIDLTQAEGLAELLEAESEAQRKSALLRAEGGVRRQIEQWRGAVLAMAAEAEVAIDYSDEEAGASVYDPAGRALALTAEIAATLAAPRVERLRDGLRIVVAGPPNAGKSSLVNALAGEQRAIVTAIAGTTRDVIEVPLALGGVPFVLVDTAGLREAEDQVEAIGVELAERELIRADIILWLGTPADAPRHPDLLQLAAKADQGEVAEGLRISSLTGEGLDALRAWLLARSTRLLPPGNKPGLTIREADLLASCQADLQAVATLNDPVLAAERLRGARLALDSISGLAGVDQLLDVLFGRFCLGK